MNSKETNNSTTLNSTMSNDYNFLPRFPFRSFVCILRDTDFPKFTVWALPEDNIAPGVEIPTRERQSVEQSLDQLHQQFARKSQPPGISSRSSLNHQGSLPGRRFAIEIVPVKMTKIWNLNNSRRRRRNLKRIESERHFLLFFRERINARLEDYVL